MILFPLLLAFTLWFGGPGNISIRPGSLGATSDMVISRSLPILPSDNLTPGVIGETDVAKVCAVDYSASIRHTSKRLKRQVYAEYGLTAKACGKCEVDHRIPLSIGGADVRENLWPQSYSTQPFNAHTKDAIEARVHAAICHEHSLTLKAGQQIFLGNWIEAYRQWFPEANAATLTH